MPLLKKKIVNTVFWNHKLKMMIKCVENTENEYKKWMNSKVPNKKGWKRNENVKS